jgi:hypothetical protein
MVYAPIIDLIVMYICSITVFYMGFHADILLLYLYALL